jgi:hypothetical protein
VTELCQFIPHALADAFRRAGWAVSPLLGHHARYSMLAVRKEKGGSVETDPALLGFAKVGNTLLAESGIPVNGSLTVAASGLKAAQTNPGSVDTCDPDLGAAGDGGVGAKGSTG